MHQNQNPESGTVSDVTISTSEPARILRSRLVIDGDRLEKLLANCKRLEAEIELSLNRLKSAR
jgi:hypothetical protein